MAHVNFKKCAYLTILFLLISGRPASLLQNIGLDIGLMNEHILGRYRANIGGQQNKGLNQTFVNSDLRHFCIQRRRGRGTEGLMAHVT